MAEEKKKTQEVKPAEASKAVPEKKANSKPFEARKKSVYAGKSGMKKRRKSGRDQKRDDEFDQKILDLARVTRVMAGGKRMRFRACVVIGNKKGKVAVGVDKGIDVAIAVNKAVNQAKKNMIEVSIVNDTIPHEVYHKLGASKILFRPSRKGRGVIAGGVVRVILEMAGVKNITAKILGTNNKLNNAKCVIAALSTLARVEKKVSDKANDKTKDGFIGKKFKKKEDKKVEKKFVKKNSSEKVAEEKESKKKDTKK